MDWGQIIAAAAPALISTFGSVFKPDYEQQKLDQGAQQFSAEQSLARDKLNQEMAIAQLQAAASGSGAGAAVAAARIKAAVDEKAIRQQAIQALMEGRLKQAELLNPEVANSAGQALAAEKRTTGQTGLQAFMSLADRLQAPLLRR
jgi:hypothetical protein